MEETRGSIGSTNLKLRALESYKVFGFSTKQAKNLGSRSDPKG